MELQSIILLLLVTAGWFGWSFMGVVFRRNKRTNERIGGGGGSIYETPKKTEQSQMRIAVRNIDI